VNPKNHQLNGRQLVVQYASADAVRRGASKALAAGGDKLTPRSSKKDAPQRAPPQKFSKKFEQPAAQEDNGEDGPADEDPGEGKWNKKPHRSDDSRPSFRQKGPRSRPKPGAALAQAKRQSAAIVESTPSAKKIVF
jgi:hypothetical protein